MSTISAINWKELIEWKTFRTQIAAMLVSFAATGILFVCYYILYIQIKNHNIKVNYEILDGDEGQEEIFLPKKTEDELEGLITKLKASSSNNDDDTIWELNGIGGTGKTAYVRSLAKDKGIEVWKCAVSKVFAAGMNPYQGETPPVEKRLQKLQQLATDREKKTGKKVIIYLDELEKSARIIPAYAHSLSVFINSNFGSIMDQNKKGKKGQFMVCTNTPLSTAMKVSEYESTAHSRKLTEVKFNEMDGYALLHWLCDSLNKNSAGQKFEYKYKELWKDANIREAANACMKELREKLIKAIKSDNSELKIVDEKVEISTQHLVKVLDHFFRSFDKGQSTDENKDAFIKEKLVELIQAFQANVDLSGNNNIPGFKEIEAQVKTLARVLEPSGQEAKLLTEIRDLAQQAVQPAL